MHSAIVYVVMPTDHYQAQMKSGAFLADIRALEKDKSVRQLGEFVWQIDFQQSPVALAQLVYFADRHSLPCKILPLDAEPQWIEGRQNQIPS